MLELIERPRPWFISLIITIGVNIKILNIFISRRRERSTRLGRILGGHEAATPSWRGRGRDLLLTVCNVIQRTSSWTRVSDFDYIRVEGDVRSANTVVVARDGGGGEGGGQFGGRRFVTATGGGGGG